MVSRRQARVQLMSDVCAQNRGVDFESESPCRVQLEKQASKIDSACSGFFFLIILCVLASMT